MFRHWRKPHGREAARYDSPRPGALGRNHRERRHDHAHEIVEPGRTEAAATELAENLAAKPPTGVASTKSAIGRFLRTGEMITSDGAAIDNVLGGRTEAYDAYVSDKLK